MGNQQPNQKTQKYKRQYNQNDITKIITEYQNGATIKKLSEIYSIPYSTIQTWITKFGVNRPSKILHRLKHDANLKDWMYRLYYEEHKTMTEIAKITGFSTRNKVKIAFDYYGFEKKTTKKDELSESVLRELYLNEQLTQFEIANIFGVSKALVNKLLKLYGLVRKIHSEKYTSLGKYCLSEKHRFVRYISYKQYALNIYDVSQNFGCSIGTIYSRINQWGLNTSEIFTKTLSVDESRVYDILQKLYPDLEIHVQSRDIIYPYELDFWIPELNLAIEVNPWYTHSLEGYTPSIHPVKAGYHSNKSLLCSTVGVDLIHLWGHEIDDLEQILKTRTLHNGLVDGDKFNKYIIESSGYTVLGHLDKYIVKDQNKIYNSLTIPDNFDYIIETAGYWEVQRL